MDCLPVPASLSSLGRPCWTHFSTFPQLRVNQCIESQIPSRLPPKPRPPCTPPISLDQSLQVHLQTRSIMARNCISKLARLWPPSSHDHCLQVHLQTSLDPHLQGNLQTGLITTSHCNSKLARSRHPTLSPNTLDYGLLLHLQTCSNRASQCISQFTGSRCGELVEQEGRQPINDTPPHLVWHPKVILQKERFCLGERRKRVRGYEGIPGHDEPHKLCGSMKAPQECVKPRAGKDWVCILYNEMMSIYPGVYQIYTPCRLVHLCMYIYGDLDNTCHGMM